MAAIGIIDSGLGGLSVWKQLHKMLPEESLYYYGDGKNCPYGNRTKAEVKQFVDQGVRLLIKHDIKMLVVACNAATALTIDYLRSQYDFPIVGMEPAVKPAAISTKSGVIGVLATAATLSGEQFKGTSAKYSDKVRILSAVGLGFVELVEAGEQDSDKAIQTVSRILEPIIEQGADKIVLGCTHYPFLQDTMNKIIAGRDVEIIDPAPAIEKRVETLLDENNLRAHKGHKVEYKFFTAADDSYIEKMRQIAGL